MTDSSNLGQAERPGDGGENPWRKGCPACEDHYSCAWRQNPGGWAHAPAPPAIWICAALLILVAGSNLFLLREPAHPLFGVALGALDIALVVGLLRRQRWAFIGVLCVSLAAVAANAVAADYLFSLANGLCALLALAGCRFYYPRARELRLQTPHRW